MELQDMGYQKTVLVEFWEDLRDSKIQMAVSV